MIAPVPITLVTTSEILIKYDTQAPEEFFSITDNSKLLFETDGHFLSVTGIDRKELNPLLHYLESIGMEASEDVLGVEYYRDFCIFFHKELDSVRFHPPAWLTHNSTAIKRPEEKVTQEKLDDLSK